MRLAFGRALADVHCLAGGCTLGSVALWAAVASWVTPVNIGYAALKGQVGVPRAAAGAPSGKGISGKLRQLLPEFRCPLVRTKFERVREPVGSWCSTRWDPTIAAPAGTCRSSNSMSPKAMHPVDRAAPGNPLVRLGAQFATPVYCRGSVSVVVVGVLQPDRCDHFAGDQVGSFGSSPAKFGSRMFRRRAATLWALSLADG